MAEEIERKYLVVKKKLPELKNGVLFIQGYLSLLPLIRFRIVGKEVCINIKQLQGNSSIRDEWEFFNKLNDKEIKKLVQLAVQKPIRKIRYKIRHKGLIWEIDEYQGENKGLITADVELPKKYSSIIFPDWIDSSKDISNDPRYFNRNLGDCPYKMFKNKQL